jgi:hypothetical protein
VRELEREAALPLGVRVPGAAVDVAVHDAFARVLAHLAAHARKATEVRPCCERVCGRDGRVCGALCA